MMTTVEAAVYLFGSADKKSTLEQYRYRNTGPKFRKIGRFVRYAQEDLDEYLNANIYSGTGHRFSDQRTSQ